LRFVAFRPFRFPVFLHRSCCSARPELRSPRAFSLLYRASSLRLAGRVSTPAPLLGLSRRSAHSFRRSPHNPVRPTAPVKVRVQGFSPSSRFAPPSALQVYFTPQTPFGFTLQGFPLFRSCHSSSLQRCRLAVGPEVALPLLASGSSGVRDRAPRLRCPYHGPTSRLCSPKESVPCRERV
jgi:hypothetical protein